jgi:hypothetical protein
MTPINRAMRQILHDPWTARIFLAFTVGMFLSCSAEFAAGQDTAGPVVHGASVVAPDGTRQVLPTTSRSRFACDATELMN